MRVEVIGKQASIGDQVRAYAEYRIFAALTRFGTAVRAVRIVLSPRAAAGGEATTLCGVTVHLIPFGRVRTRVVGRLPSEAIDRAAHRICNALSRRLGRRLSS